jgi:glutathione S-transferase
MMNSETVELLGIPQGNFVRAVRMYCEEKNIKYELKDLRPHAPEVLAIHPLGKVPAMRHGDLTLCESRAIVAYLEGVFPEPPLLPRDPRSAALCEQWISMVNTSIDRTMVRDYALGYLFPKGAGGQPDRAAIDAAVPVLQEQVAVLDRAVAATGHLVGDSLTYADIVLLPSSTPCAICRKAGPRSTPRRL